MIQITYNVTYDGKSYGQNDIEEALFKASEIYVKDLIKNKLENFKGFDNDSVTINIDLMNGQINIGSISNEKAKREIIDILSELTLN